MKNGTLAGIVLVTNPLAREQAMEIWRRPAREFERVRLRLPVAADQIMRSNQLAQGVSLEAVLERVRSLFDPRSHRFILVTQSHGSAELAMTPRLVSWAADLGKDGILRLARGEADLGHPRPGSPRASSSASSRPPAVAGWNFR